RCAGTPQALILPGAAFFCGAGPDFVWNSWPGWASVPDFLLIGAPLASTECRVGILGCPHAILPQDGCFLAGALAARSRRVLCHTKMPRPEFPRVVGCDRSAPVRLATGAGPTDCLRPSPPGQGFSGRRPCSPEGSTQAEGCCARVAGIPGR